MMCELLYVDPGGGSYLLQVLVAAVLGAAFWIKMSWQRLKAFLLRKNFKKKENKQETP
jgi:hypothetical protein